MHRQWHYTVYASSTSSFMHRALNSCVFRMQCFFLPSVRITAPAASCVTGQAWAVSWIPPPQLQAALALQLSVPSQ